MIKVLDLRVTLTFRIKGFNVLHKIIIFVNIRIKGFRIKGFCTADLIKLWTV